MSTLNTKVPLNIQETGTLCHLLMRTFGENGGLLNQPTWAILLYQKLAAANDKLMGKS